MFRNGIDKLNITIAAVGQYYRASRFAGRIVFECDLMAPSALAARLVFGLDMIMRLVRMIAAENLTMARRGSPRATIRSMGWPQQG